MALKAAIDIDHLERVVLSACNVHIVQAPLACEEVLAMIAELRAAREVVEAARWYQQCRDNVERRVRVTGMDEAREGLRAALAKVESNRE